MALDTRPALRRKATVRAANDLVGVPAGTEGQVIIVNGLTWIRYWVRFENGVVLGSINRLDLATPEEWARKLAGGDDETAATDAAADAEDEAGLGGDGDGDVTVNGVVVPGRLIERAKAARARLAA